MSKRAPSTRPHWFRDASEPVERPSWLDGMQSEVTSVSFRCIDEPQPHDSDEDEVEEGTSEAQHATADTGDVEEPPVPDPPPGTQWVTDEEIARLRAIEIAHEEQQLVLEEMRTRSESFANAVIDLGVARSRAIRAVESSLLDLAVGIATVIVEREIRAEPEALLRLARAALRTLGDTSHAKLLASKETYDTVVENLGDPVVPFDGVNVELHLDESLDGLGCVAEEPQGRVDGRVHERLMGVLRALHDERRRYAGEAA